MPAPVKPPTVLKNSAGNSDVFAPQASDLKKYTSDIEGSGKLIAAIKTSMGTINCELLEEDAPATVANFVGLARGLKSWTHPKTRQLMKNKSLYEGVIFHRVIPKFMIQTGDPLGVGMGGPGYKFDDEVDNDHTFNKPGILAMANSNRPGQPGINGGGTNGSQIFITEVPTPHLNNKHTIFGYCDNVELVKSIARVPKAEGRRQKPATDITIDKVSFSRK